jgi:hypothetical protein
MCPPTSFSDHRTGASEKIRSPPRKTFFNSIDPKPTLRVKGVNALLIYGHEAANDSPTGDRLTSGTNPLIPEPTEADAPSPASRMPATSI